MVYASLRKVYAGLRKVYAVFTQCLRTATNESLRKKMSFCVNIGASAYTLRKPCVNDVIFRSIYASLRNLTHVYARFKQNTLTWEHILKHYHAMGRILLLNNGVLFRLWVEDTFLKWI